jgi:5'-phosphate synthase pdxT subunit
MLCVGVLALQGDYAAHAARLRELNADVLEVRRAEDLEKVDALIIPGGESTAMLRLMTEELRDDLSRKIRDGFPVFATCAGLILLAKNVYSPKQDSLNVIDVDVERNSYGRQLDSFTTDKIVWTKAGKDALSKALNGETPEEPALEGVFIRAPRMIRTGDSVDVLVTLEGEPMLVRQGNVLAATFHPELSDQAIDIHRLFLASIPVTNL